jgi:hypothetical protein
MSSSRYADAKNAGYHCKSVNQKSFTQGGDCLSLPPSSSSSVFRLPLLRRRLRVRCSRVACPKSTTPMNPILEPHRAQQERDRDQVVEES